MSKNYHFADGSPRYGRRTEGTAPAAVPATRVEEVPEAAALLGLDELSAAIDRRLASAWADAPDPAVTALRAENPEELAAARVLVRLHLGSQLQWRFKAQAVRDGQLAELLARRRAAGSTRAILALRLGLIAALIAPPAYIVFTDPDGLVKLLISGVLCFAAALAGGHCLTVRARIPVAPDIRGPWLREIREDVVNATLVAILQNKGAPLRPETVAAGRRGWLSIEDAARTQTAAAGRCMASLRKNT